MLRGAFKSLALLAVVGLVLGARQAQAVLLHSGGGSSGGGRGSSGRSSVIGPASKPAISPKTLSATRLDDAPPPPPPSPTNHPTYGPLPNEALLSVKVPADAKVFINGRPTPSTGADREYISRYLQGIAHYNYAVRVEFIRNGQPVSENKTVQLTSGQSANLDFTQGEARVQRATNPKTLKTLTGQAPDGKLYSSGKK
jgi:uncharacterized protein (TIGR03000 family)